MDASRYVRRSTVVAPRGVLHAGCFTGAAPRGSLHAGGSTEVALRGSFSAGERSQIFFYTDVRSILMVLLAHFKGRLVEMMTAEELDDGAPLPQYQEPDEID